MKVLVLISIPALLLAQAESRTSTYRGANGEAVVMPQPPKVKVEEKVLREDASGRVVERVVRPFDSEGRPLPIEKTVIEESKGADGGSVVRTTVYRADISGHLKLTQRETLQVSGSKDYTQEQRIVERPDLNGGLAVAEKSQAVTQSNGSDSKRDMVVFRPALSGRFETAYREVSQSRTVGGRTEVQTDKYEAASTGNMTLTGQETSSTTRQPDGTMVQEVTVYGLAAPGRVAQPGKPQLREQRVVETKPVAGGTVETVSIRRPSVTDQKLPAGYTKVAETVCAGCKLSGGPDTSASQAQTASPKN
ncbi:MAG: hypothetical protein SFV54_22980 [Bryobacteraceae bacterium]|nr:hypothetical protein [Bryobacteraceae bacterium]